MVGPSVGAGGTDDVTGSVASSEVVTGGVDAREDDPVVGALVVPADDAADTAVVGEVVGATLGCPGVEQATRSSAEHSNLKPAATEV